MSEFDCDLEVSWLDLRRRNEGGNGDRNANYSWLKGTKYIEKEIWPGFSQLKLKAFVSGFEAKFEHPGKGEWRCESESLSFRTAHFRDAL